MRVSDPFGKSSTLRLLDVPAHQKERFMRRSRYGVLEVFE
jgi:hypothetical protein